MGQKSKIESRAQYLRKARREPRLSVRIHPTNCYQIGDIGPGGGIIFSIPFTGHNNTSSTYYEVAPVDVSINSVTTSYFATTPTCHVQPETGAEFGAYTHTLSTAFINNSYTIGHGLHNTNILDLIPLAPGSHPVISGHDIAAKLCKTYVGPNGNTDWFLPSATEALDLILSIGVNSSFANIANLQTSLNNPASGFYWTSSVPIGAISNTVAVAFAHSSSVSILLHLERCVTASVRPIRRFQCAPDLPIRIDPIRVDLGLTVATVPGIAYNYRYVKNNLGCGSVMWTQGVPGPTGGSSFIMQGSSHVIGDPNYMINMQVSKEDVAGNVYTAFELTGHLFGMTPIGFLPNGMPIWPHQVAYYKISVWDINENFKGSWLYELSTAQQKLCGAGLNCADQVRLRNPVHLAGPDPILNIIDVTKFPTVPECLGCDAGPYPAGAMPTGPVCISSTNPVGCKPHPLEFNSLAYVRMEQFYMLQNPYGNTANLTNYAGTGRNLRFIGANTAWSDNSKDFEYFCQACSYTWPNNYSCSPWLKEIAPPLGLIHGLDPYCKYTPNMPCRPNLSGNPIIRPGGYGTIEFDEDPPCFNEVTGRG
jgi:hypothetical protein